MKEKTSYLLNVILAIGLFLIVFRECKKPQPTKIIIKDTSTYVQRAENTRFDTIERHYLNEFQKQDNEITRLKERLKQAKIVYKYLPAKNRVDTLDLDCCKQLSGANEIIMYSDSLTNVYGTSLAECLNRVENLNAQVKFNKEFANRTNADQAETLRELASYHHVIWRLYRKR